MKHTWVKRILAVSLSTAMMLTGTRTVRAEEYASNTASDLTVQESLADNGIPADFSKAQQQNRNGLYNDGGSWYYYVNGEIDTSYTGLCNQFGSWWYVENGRVNLNATGLCNQFGSWWYVENGRVNLNATGLYQHGNSWYFVQNGKVNFEANGLWNQYGNWYYIENGEYKPKATGLCQYGDNLYFVQNGKVNFKVTGIWEQEGIQWYVRDGVWDYEYSGILSWNGNRYNVMEGEVVAVLTESDVIVPLENLDNLGNFRKRCTDEELQAAYDVALEVVTPLLGLSRENQLRGIAYILRSMVENGYVEYSTNAPHYNDPYGYFVSGVASCAGCTRATGMCLNMLGISYEHVNENQWTHQWCRVNINGTYWICDAYGLYVGPEPAPYVHPYF